MINPRTIRDIAAAEERAEAMRGKLANTTAVPAQHRHMLPAMRLGVYTDYTYSLVGGRPHASRAFALFLDAMSRQLDEVTVIGRLNPAIDAHYPLGGAGLVALPNYPSLNHTLPAIRGMFGSLRPFWRALDHIDCLWIFGPHPLAFAFAFLARLRGRPVVLGVRQDSVAYMRHRHPSSRVKIAIARLMDWGFRMLARRWPVVVVGPAIAATYEHGSRVLEISVSLIREEDIVGAEVAETRSYGGELTALSVGRLEEEKNPLALADVLLALRERDDRWRLVVCGEGDMSDALERRLNELGLGEHAQLRGYVPQEGGLRDQYRMAHSLVHVSWTEGLPQIVFEAFAAGLPVVATDVGGIAAAVGDAALFAPPGDPQRTAGLVARVGREPELRSRLIGKGLELARRHTIEIEIKRVASFIRDFAGPRS
jgi:glycosyltransferase involved in cell wall biosynthesis